MSDHSKIEWTDATWNPVTGCDHASPGCDNCYAERIAARFHRPFLGAVETHAGKLNDPLRWRRPRRVFVNSVSDLFHPDVPTSFVVDVFARMAIAETHEFQILTKRPDRMAKFVAAPSFAADVLAAVYRLVVADRSPIEARRRSNLRLRARASEPLAAWPLPNVWLGVSVENQRYAELRIPKLLAAPAVVRFLSVEPLLGPVDLRWRPPADATHMNLAYVVAGLDWVIVGGESGPGARPMHPAWARTIRDQCVAARVPFFFKQWGEYRPVPVYDDPHMAGGRAYEMIDGGVAAAVMRESRRPPVWATMKAGDENGNGVMLDDDTFALRVGKTRAGRELDGRTWDEYPTPRAR